MKIFESHIYDFFSCRFPYLWIHIYKHVFFRGNISSFFGIWHPDPRLGKIENLRKKIQTFFSKWFFSMMRKYFLMGFFLNFIFWSRRIVLKWFRDDSDHSEVPIHHCNKTKFWWYSGNSAVTFCHHLAVTISRFRTPHFGRT